MSSLNKVILIGNLGRDPETRYMSNGDCITSFSIATSEKWIDKQTSEKREQTEWHNITAFRKLGEICAKYLKKGSSIYCEGKLNTQKYVDKDGLEKYVTKIIIDSMQMLGNGPADQTVKKEQKAQLLQKEQVKPKVIFERTQDFSSIENDDIPF